MTVEIYPQDLDVTDRRYKKKVFAASQQSNIFPGFKIK